MTSVSFYEYSRLNVEEKAALLRRSESDISSFIEKVAPILEAVRTEGDKALARFGRELDKAAATEANRKGTEAEVDAAFKLVAEGDPARRLCRCPFYAHPVGRPLCAAR